MKFFFWAPNPTRLGLEFNVKTFLANWDYFILFLSIVVFAICFGYYLTRPGKWAFVRYWIIFIIGFVISLCAPIVYLYLKFDQYTKKPEAVNKADFFSATIIYSLFRYFIIFLLIYILVLYFGQFKGRNRIRAMRKFPFKFMP